MSIGARLYETAKRLLDIAGASAGLLIVSPLLLAVAVAVKSDSPGPIFFRQVRLGRNGKPFTFLKFRSMQVDANRLQVALMRRNEVTGPVFKIKSDPRITRVGKIIRRYSLDELPQLWHVLVGQMTLVGPRPPLPNEVARYEAWQTERLAVKPGLTCTWQVSGRSDIPFEQWVQMDIEYVRRRNLLLDLKLLALTLPAVVTARGAY
jgi:lipopolysaccharide/colanic/teichoic acid biosynthesis glycosyltransferase